MVAALALCAGTAMAQNVTTAPAPTFPERHPNQTTTLHAISFADDFNIPIWIAQRQGFFAAEKLDVKLDFTPGSTWQITHLLAGNYDIAYRKGQNEAYIPPEVKVDLTSVLNSDNAFFSVSAQGNVKQFADLRGRTVTAGAMTTGFAFVLHEVLGKQGVPEADVKFERAGDVSSRFRAMTTNPNHAATTQMTLFARRVVWNSPQMRIPV